MTWGKKIAKEKIYTTNLLIKIHYFAPAAFFAAASSCFFLIISASLNNTNIKRITNKKHIKETFHVLH